MTKSNKPILCVDFDGVIHSYTSGWKDADIIPDGPVEGAIMYLRNALEYFDVQIYSSRSWQPGGINAMQEWLLKVSDDSSLVERIGWPDAKPAAFLTIDDRAICFQGSFSDIHPATLLNFKPWNKR